MVQNNSMFEKLPAEIQQVVAFSQTVCEKCDKCLGIHHLSDGHVAINSTESTEPLIVTNEDWRALVNQIRTGKVR
jgi:hypothetical protein